MDNRKLVDAISRIVKLQVSREIKTLRAGIISEVAGMLNYSERALLVKLTEYKAQTEHPVQPEPVEHRTGGMSYQRALENMKSMPNYRHLDGVETPAKAPKRITSNPMLNDILNETTPLDSERSSRDMMSQYNDGDMSGVYDEPWINDVPSHQPQRRQSVPPVIDATDLSGRPVNPDNPAVQKVMDILSNTNFKDKFERISEAGDNFRDMGSTAPRFSSDHFDKTVVNH